ncbi:MAG: CDP-diacylglycerol--glycerol-3-phosphate 3-phosphatidyltransferase [Firmicutes bacterium]|nr:CDP-diacylglycerol--glycerol-3-phosphate 3-phosphatidyltransferase [Bacillota bacterium]
MNLPNLLTLIRILLVPILVVVLMTRVQHHQIIGAVVFWAASITDFYDGYLARKYRQITVLGKLLDPLADKLLIAAALISLIELNKTPAWMVFIILAREMAITGLRGLASEEGITIPADWIGKWKLGAQIAAISCLIFGPVLDGWLYLWTGLPVFHQWSVAMFFRGALNTHEPWGLFVGFGQILMWVSLILAIWSAIVYFMTFWRKVGSRILTGTGRLTGEDSSEHRP